MGLFFSAESNAWGPHTVQGRYSTTELHPYPYENRQYIFMTGKKSKYIAKCVSHPSPFHIYAYAQSDMSLCPSFLLY